MKTSTFRSMLATICALALFALAACGGGNAHAATLSGNFVSDDGKVFQIENAISIEKVTGAVNVAAANGTTYAFADGTGALYNKILASVGFTSHYIQVPGTLMHMNTTAALYITCYGGNQTAFAYPPNLPAKFFADNCALLNAIKAASN